MKVVSVLDVVDVEELDQEEDPAVEEETVMLVAREVEEASAEELLPVEEDGELLLVPEEITVLHPGCPGTLTPSKALALVLLLIFPERF